LFILTIISLALAARNPGIKLAVKQPILAGMKDAYLPSVMESILTAPIPNMDQGDMELKNIKIKTLKVDPANVVVTLYDGYFQIDALSFDIIITMTGEKSVWGIPFTTNLVASAKNSTFGMKISSTYPIDRLNFNVYDVLVILRNEDLKCDSFLAKSEVSSMLKSGAFKAMFSDALAGQLKAQGEQTLNSVVGQAVTNMALPGTPLSIDYTLTNNLVYTPNGITVSLDGTIYSTAKGYIPRDPVELILPDGDPLSASDIQIFISHYLFNTALQELYEEKLLALTLTHESIPDLDMLPYKLDTKSLSALIPGLEDKYGDQPVSLNCYNKEGVAPQLSIAQGKIDGKVAISCEVYVQDAETAEWIQALTINSGINVVSSIGVISEDNTLAITMERASASDVEVISNDLPVEATEYLQVGLNLVLDIFLPYTHYLPLPTIPQITLQNPEVFTKDGYISMASGGNPTTFTGYHPMPNSNTADYIIHKTSDSSRLAFIGTLLVALIALLF